MNVHLSVLCLIQQLYHRRQDVHELGPGTPVWPDSKSVHSLVRTGTLLLQASQDPPCFGSEATTALQVSIAVVLVVSHCFWKYGKTMDSPPAARGPEQQRGSPALHSRTGMQLAAGSSMLQNRLSPPGRYIKRPRDKSFNLTSGLAQGCETGGGLAKQTWTSPVQAASIRLGLWLKGVGSRQTRICSPSPNRPNPFLLARSLSRTPVATVGNLLNGPLVHVPSSSLLGHLQVGIAWLCALALNLTCSKAFLERLGNPVEQEFV